MSGSLKIKLSMDNQRLVKRLTTDVVNSAFVAQVQSEVVDGQIKKAMLSGLSPVRGRGRFNAYKDPAKYPGDDKTRKRLKPNRPVNLYLTGELQKWLVAIKNTAKAGTSLFVGIDPNAPKNVKGKALGNNEGTFNASTGEFQIVDRRFIPLEGEQWNVTITRTIKDLFAKRLQQLFNDGRYK